MARPKRTTEQIFWDHVERLGDDDCWNWRGSLTNGYGRIKIDDHHSMGAHRYSYTIHRGPIPDGLDICHKCDNPACCNPNHLWPGTAKDNCADMFRKGRANRSKGVRRPAAKLNDETVQQIRAWIAEGISQREIARRLNVSQPAVCYVNTHKMWKHV